VILSLFLLFHPLVPDAFGAEQTFSKVLPMSHREISGGWMIGLVTKAGQEFSKMFFQNAFV